MITRLVGDIEVPALGLGTWPMKGTECSAAVHAALSVGYRHIDTAARYGNEEAVGEGIKASGIGRSSVFLTTKVWYDQLGKEDLLSSARDSLKRLGTDYVDLLLVHWPNAAIPLDETIDGLLSARQGGLARSVGVSNFPSELLRRAQHLSGETLVTNQVEYHPFLSQKTVLKTCRDLGMCLTAYQPIAGGAVNGDETIRDIAAGHRRTAAQVALRWLLQQDSVIAVPKSSHVSRITSNFDVFDFSLSESEMEAISTLGSPTGRRVNVSWAPDWDAA